jgi:hypothetical protein
MRRISSPHRLAIAAAFVTHALGAVAQSVMQPGGWEMHATISAQDPATGETKTLSEATMKQCLSAAFLDKDPYLTPGIDKEKMIQRGATCSLADEKRAENSASWRMACRLADGTLIDMTINNSVSKETLQSEIRQVVDKGGKKVQMQIAMNSKFVGACTKDMPQL